VAPFLMSTILPGSALRAEIFVTDPLGLRRSDAAWRTVSL
jgi:hypothetical protein